MHMASYVLEGQMSHSRLALKERVASICPPRTGNSTGGWLSSAQSFHSTSGCDRLRRQEVVLLTEVQLEHRLRVLKEPSFL